MAKILFLFTKLRGESELERGGIVEREPDRKRQTDKQRILNTHDEYLVLKTTQTLFTLMLGFE